jgi:hypothetical protein
MPALKSKIENKADFDALPDALRGFYLETNGTYRLDADFEDVGGLKSALEKERTSRSTLEKTLGDLKRQLGDADPAKAREAVKKLQELEDQKLISEGKLEEILKSRTERIVADYDGKIRERDEKLTAAEKRLEELVIDNELRKIAATKKVRDTAVDDFVERGRKVYRLKDGKAVPMKGEDVIFGKKPNEPMGMDEWADSLAPTAPHLFAESSGGGASNHGAGGGSGKGPHTITAEQAKDYSAYKQASEAAAKAGAQLQVV